MTVRYSISTQQVQARGLAAVRRRMPIAAVPSRFGSLLGNVYTTARDAGIGLDGQNVFVYRDDDAGLVDVAFGVGVAAPFVALGDVSYFETPAGLVATTTHWGDYANLGDAHAAVITWCRDSALELDGARWEVYGHWSDDPTARRTDVYYLIESPGTNRSIANVD